MNHPTLTGLGLLLIALAMPALLGAQDRPERKPRFEPTPAPSPTAKESAPMPAPLKEAGEGHVHADTKPTSMKTDWESIWAFGGSVAITNGLVQPGGARTRGIMVEEGFVGEIAFHASVDPTERAGGTFRACWSCHSLEVEEAAFNFHASKYLSVKGGRLSLPFGAIAGRHDQTLLSTVSKPLTGAMGNMVNGAAFNQGVIPQPLVDNGVGITGRADVGDGFRLSYDFFAVAGMKGEGADLDFVVSRDMTDNNAEPSFTGRLGFGRSAFASGFSFLVGRHDSDSRLSHYAWGLDARTRIGPLSLAFEYASRTTQYESSAGLRTAHQKRAIWGQAGFAVMPGWVQVLVAADYLAMTGVYLGNAGPRPGALGAVTDKRNEVYRLTGGVVVTPYSEIVLKIDIEYWNFSDFTDVWVFQAGAAWSF